MKLLLSTLYYFVYKIHHKFFLKKRPPLLHAKLIVIGSFLSGGAGKTPFCIWLCNFLKNQERYKTKKIAILCHTVASDEANLLRKNLPSVKVFTTKNRYKIAHEIDSLFDFIICDDGFEDSRLSFAFIIRLDWDNPPKSIKQLIPFGKYRSLEKDHTIPNLVITKREFHFSIESIKNVNGKNCPKSVYAMCAIGNPQRFLEDLNCFGVFPLKFIYKRDHYKKFEQSLSILLEKGFPVIVTEKDYERLSISTQKNPLVYVAYQKIVCSLKICNSILRLFLE